MSANSRIENWSGLFRCLKVAVQPAPGGANAKLDELPGAMSFIATFLDLPVCVSNVIIAKEICASLNSYGW
jgi:hypothetical protein